MQTMHALDTCDFLTFDLLRQGTKTEILLGINVIRSWMQSYPVVTAQCTLVHMRGLGIACRPSVRLSVCDVGDL